MHFTSADIPFRIRIGVTGHRDLLARGQDPQVLASLVDEAVFKRLEEVFAPDARRRFREAREKNAPPVRYSVVSALAEGADRLVARTVLQHEGSTIEAVLPLVREDYVSGFVSAGSKDEFEELLERCRRPHYLRHVALACEYPDPATQAEMRRVAYAAGGRFVVDHCDVLVALWDGQPPKGRGGTSDVVSYARSQGRPLIVIWDAAIQTIEGSLDPTAAIEAIDRYNHLPLTVEQLAGKEAELKRRYFTSVTAAAIPDTSRDLVLRHLVPHSAKASLMAQGNQESFFGAGRYVYLLSALAVACVALAVLIEPIAPWGFGAELVVLIALTAILDRSRRQRHHTRWMDYRFLTERLRCAIFMALVGVEPDDIEVPPFLAHSHRIDDWTVRTFDEIWGRLPRLSGCAAQGHCFLVSPYICEVWIQGQIDFHKKKSLAEGSRRKALERILSLLLPATIAAAFGHTVWHWIPEEVAHLRWFSGALTFVAIVFPATAASVAGIQATREHLRLEKRSESMVRELSKLGVEMETATDPIHFEMLLRSTDRLMLRENQEWLTLMRFVEIKG